MPINAKGELVLLTVAYHSEQPLNFLAEELSRQTHQPSQWIVVNNSPTSAGPLNISPSHSFLSIIQGEEIFKEFKGALIENAVAIVLAQLFDHKLHYWTSGNTAEVDFLWQLDKGIFPIEVKSGSSNKKKSLRI